MTQYHPLIFNNMQLKTSHILYNIILYCFLLLHTSAFFLNFLLPPNVPPFKISLNTSFDLVFSAYFIFCSLTSLFSSFIKPTTMSDHSTTNPELLAALQRATLTTSQASSSAKGSPAVSIFSQHSPHMSPPLPCTSKSSLIVVGILVNC